MQARPTLAPGALPDWSAVPSSTEEDRAFFAQRLGYFGAAMFWLSSAFLVLNTALSWAFVPETRWVPAFWNLSAGLHLAAACLSGLQALVCWKASPSPRVLNLVDIGVFLLILVAYGLMVMCEAPSFEQVLIFNLITLIYVMARAVIVPGTSRRTLWISTVASLPVVVVSSIVIDRQRALSGNNNPLLGLMAVSYTAMWCAAGVACATLASRVIYGLQQRVLEATQLGQYTLERKIGEGGMGAVYRARHALLRRPTAVKLLPRGRAGHRDLARFEREVQLTASLTHPNTIAVFDYGHTPDGVFYYAMEYLDGITLEDLVSLDGAVPAARAVHLLRQVCGALAEAHQVGLIHRDVKPANVMTCVRGRIADHVKVLDFGLVKDVDRSDAADLSTEGHLLGTPLYMAPEAIVSPDRIDARADIYALGAVGYFLLAGTPPFEGATLVEICGKHLHATPEPPSKRAGIWLPADLEALVLQCLAKEPADRPSSAAALESALATLGDIGTWSADDASDWWEVRGPKVRGRLEVRATGQSRSPGPATVAIDLAERRSAS